MSEYTAHLLADYGDLEKYHGEYRNQYGFLSHAVQGSSHQAVLGAFADAIEDADDYERAKLLHALRHLQFDDLGRGIVAY